MGLPAGQLSNKYVFPAYNNVTLNEQLRIGNVDTVSTTVTVTIGGVCSGTYPLGRGTSCAYQLCWLGQWSGDRGGDSWSEHHFVDPRCLGGQRGHHQLLAVDGYASRSSSRINMSSRLQQCDLE